MSRYQIRRPGAAVIAVAFATAASGAHADEGQSLTDTIVVTGHRQPALEAEVEPVTAHATAPDAAVLVARLPGAAVIGNGPISGQVQYRGLFSERLGIRINGQPFQTGGPNAMDPPLHYAPTVLVDRITVSRGAAPVSKGAGFGGMVEAELKRVDFGNSADLAPAADVAGQWRSADNSVAVGGVAGLATDSLRLNAIGSWERGHDYRVPGGRVADTDYRRLTYGFSAGLRQSGNVLSLDVRRQETGKGGNPPFAMDIIYFHTDFARAAFDGTIGGAPVNLALNYAGVEHLMDNYSLRPAPAMAAMRRATYAEAHTYNAAGTVGLGPLKLGSELTLVDRHVQITNPFVTGFVIGSLDRVRERRLAGFAELAGKLGDWQGDLGVRVENWHGRMAAPLTGAAVPAMVRMLAAQVGAASKPLAATTVDAVARIWRETGTLRPRLTLARKTRVANAVERFGWLPTEASGGLADGNIYIGNRALKPEVAWSAEAGVDLVTPALTLRPSLFYRRVDNYIQGVPVPATMPTQIAIATMNGDATPMIFGNVDAELYGFDGDLRWDIAPMLRFEASASYVRGKRRDIVDNLYRIAPLRGRASVTYGGESWSVTAEAVASAAQRKVSATNSESSSPGWAIANLWFDARLSGNVQISGGIENLFDRRYADHLAGVNRVSGGVLASGERLPGTGRSVMVRLGLAW